MIAIVDYGLGNLGSIKNMLKKIGYQCIITSSSEEILQADKLILPGVGSFDIGMENLENLGLDIVIKEYAEVLKKPILGICLGMQLLGGSSEEGIKKGLGLIPFKSVRFKFDSVNKSLKIPHMGWNYVFKKSKRLKIYNRLLDNQRYYFVHSFHAVCQNKENILFETEYGYKFVSGVVKNNIYGVQFHPEKSHKYGIGFLKSFLEV